MLNARLSDREVRLSLALHSGQKAQNAVSIDTCSIGIDTKGRLITGNQMHLKCKKNVVTFIFLSLYAGILDDSSH